MLDLPKRAWAYFAVVAAISFAVVFVQAQHTHIQLVVVAFGILLFATDMAPITLRDVTYTVSHIIAVAALIALGPASAAIAASFGGLVHIFGKRPRYWSGRVVFNAAQLALTTAISGAVYVALGGPVGSLSGHDFPRVLGAIIVATVVYYLVNALLVGSGISIIRQKGLREVLHENYSSIAGGTIAFSLVGLLLGALYFLIGFWAMVFIIVPVLLARRVLQATARMDEAYESTLRALVTAIEAKDAYTRGHAERVSKLTTMIARELGFTEKSVHNIRIAALMHDVGKLVVSTAILTKPGKLTDEEYEHMKWHPIFGCEVIEEIEFLRDGEAVNAVRHHHERLDGRGYPDNLFGDDVPLTARVVMVADAFDSMTSTRTYRFAKSVDDGLRELRRCAATQFDPLCIAALDRAVHKHGWEPTPELYAGEQTERPAVSVHAQHA